MQLCDYGCGQEAKHQLKNGKWCCSKSHNSCPIKRKKQAKKMKKIWNKLDSEYNSDLYREKISNNLKEARKDIYSKYNSILYKIKRKLTIEKINKKYLFFSKIEEMRYNPDKPDKKEIQVHYKNYNCKNSKEKNGWFTPTQTQIKSRKDCLENEGFDGSYFYCSQHCKDTCPLYNLRGDPYKETKLPYTAAEKEVWRQVVLERENDLCEYCGEPAEHVHHIFPVKLEPFFALDPDYGVACCEKHHYKCT